MIGAGRQGGAATGAGDGADGEGTFSATGGAVKNGGLEAWRQRRNDCESGQRRGDDRWPNGYSFVLDPNFPLPGS